MKASSALLARLPSFNRQRFLSWLGYAGFFWFCFILFAYWNFPYSRARTFIIHEVSQRTGYQLSIDELSPHWGTGVHLEGVTLTRPAANADSEPAELELAEATVSISPLSLLGGKTSVSFSASTGEGSAEGSYTEAGEMFELLVDLDALDLGLLGVGGWIGLPLRGQATGNVSLLMPEVGNDPSITAELAIAQLSLGDGKAKFIPPGMRDGITIEKINAGTLTLQIATEAGIAMVKQFHGAGVDLKLTGDGTMRIGRPLPRSRADLSVGVTFTQAYKERSDRTKALFQLLDFQPDIKRATSDDGTMTFHLSGPILALRGAPAGAPGAATNARKPRIRRKK